MVYVNSITIINYYWLMQLKLLHIYIYKIYNKYIYIW